MQSNKRKLEDTVNIHEVLKIILATELNVKNELLDENKLLFELFEESLIGTPEENYTGGGLLTPSVCVSISFIMTIESEFNIDFTDEEAGCLVEKGRIIDLINLIKKRLL